MDFDEALAATEQRPGTRCTVATVLEALDDVQRAKVEAALDPESGKSTAWLARAFKKMGLDCRESPIGRHRRGDCECRRRAGA